MIKDRAAVRNWCEQNLFSECKLCSSLKLKLGVKIILGAESLLNSDKMQNKNFMASFQLTQISEILVISDHGWFLFRNLQTKYKRSQSGV